MEYKKGQYIRYAANGVCLIEDIKIIDYNHSNNPKTFYVLKPISAQASTIYIPTENSELVSKMRHLLDKSEVDALIDTVKLEKTEWISDRKVRSNAFRQILKDSVPLELLKLILCIYLKKIEMSNEGKKLSSTDESILSQAEALIENEFAFVLKLDGIDVRKYIISRLGVN